MYKLLGTDQKEYGPVSAEQIRAWIAQGRANAKTQLQPVGTTEWKPLAEFPEFAAGLQPAGASPAPPPPAAGNPPGASAPKTSGLAIASLVLGCVGLVSCGITSLVGLVLGIIALVRIGKSQGQMGGKGLALAGTIVSAALLLLLPIQAALLLPALARAQQKAQGIQCMNNVKQLEVAVLMYANANQDMFPAGSNWCDAIKPYVGSEKVYLCQSARSGERSHYAFNAQLAGHAVKDVQAPAQTVLVFESDGGWNLSGGRQLIPATPRHNRVYVVGFADGHVEMVRPDRLDKLHWEP